MVLIYYITNAKINCKFGGLCIESPDWIKKKKATINLKNKVDRCIQYAATVALNYGEIKWNLERISKIKQFIYKYNWDKYPSKLDDSKTFEKNNPTITLNILYTKEMEICPALVLSSCKKTVCITKRNKRKK